MTQTYQKINQETPVDFFLWKKPICIGIMATFAYSFWPEERPERFRRGVRVVEGARLESV